MNIAVAFSFLVLISWANSSLGFNGNVDPTALPGPKEDRAGMGDRSANEFFGERRSSQAPAAATCKTALDKKRSLLKLKRSELRDLVAQIRSKAQDEKREFLDDERKRINDAEDQVRRLIATSNELMNQCGECFANPVKTQRLELANGQKETWYLGDGSCQFEAADPGSAERAYTAAVERLSHPHRYPYKRGGFRNIVEVITLNPNTLEVLPASTELLREQVQEPALKKEVDVAFSSPPEMLGMWIRGIELPRGSLSSYWYLTVNEITHPNVDDSRPEFYITYRTPMVAAAQNDAYQGVAEKARLFHLDEPIREANLLGEDRNSGTTPLSKLTGSWWIRLNGNKVDARYCTNAVMGIPLVALEKLGKSILLETLSEMLDLVKTAANSPDQKEE